MNGLTRVRRMSRVEGLGSAILAGYCCLSALLGVLILIALAAGWPRRGEETNRR